MKSYILFLLLILTHFTSLGQTYTYQNVATSVREDNSTNNKFDLVEPNPNNRIVNDSLYLDFSISFSAKLLKSSDALIITPVYKTSSTEHRFPPILINGKRRHSHYKREQALASHKDYWEKKPYAVLVQNKRANSLNYKSSYHLSHNIGSGKLYLEYVLQDCCDKCLVNIIPLDLKQNLNYENLVSFITPKIEKEKIRKEHISLRIDYPVNQYRILPYFSRNAYELSRLDTVLYRLSSSNKDYSIQRISISAYASPEATYKYNMQLSNRRAFYFKTYLLDKYKLSDVASFTSKGLGEDWSGLRKLVSSSSVDYKGAVLYIIDNVDIFSGREKQLMDLYGGVPYRYMLNNMFPKLRRMEMIIDYSVRSFESDEVGSLINERPQDLSQYELYDYALKHKDNRPFNVAVKYFPDDATANINASSSALIAGDASLALFYLKKVWENPQAYNNIGVYYLLKGDVAKAKEWFLKAISHSGDVSKAKYNLEQISK